MADGTKIEWTEATWNPITGCSVVSPGCAHCYAMKLAGTRLKNITSRAGLTRDTKAGPVWTGEVRLNKEWLEQPFGWSRPRMIFVCAHGDLFHENVPDEWIDRVFAIMALSPEHTFQVLTKRAARMRAYFAANPWPVIEQVAWGIMLCDTLSDIGLPLRNVWLGVSVEDQARADERIPDLLATPAAVRWISAEPLLEPVDFAVVWDADPLGRPPWPHVVDALTGEASDEENGPVSVHEPGSAPRIHWVVGGGESGRGARDADPAWFRSLRDQCAQAGVPYFHKQMAHKAEIPPDLMVRQWPRGVADTRPPIR